jgi:hypothetical protein
MLLSYATLVGARDALVEDAEPAAVASSVAAGMEAILLAIFLQAPPSGIVMSGVLGQVVWLILRVTGAAMLLSIGIAFRNQVAR